jgi:hypothetical protein
MFRQCTIFVFHFLLQFFFPANIDQPEFFIAEISKVDHFKDRLEFMRFKKKVQWHLFEIDQQLRELHTACDEISNR